MNRRLWQSVVSGLVLATVAPTYADGPAKPGSESAAPLKRMVGVRLVNFTMKDARTGRPVSLKDFRGQHALVLAFLGTDCPVGNLYAPRLAEIAREFAPKKVTVLGIYSNAHETPAQIAEAAEGHGVTFPVLKDEGNVVADTALVERTCEVIVLDGMATIRYRGAIDDQYGVGTRKDAPAHHYLRDALNEVLTGGRVDVTATPVVGCLLDRVEPKPAKAVAGNASRVRPAAAEIIAAIKEQGEEVVTVGRVTYAEDVAPIVAAKCQACHRPGEVGPFPLLGYDDARTHSAMIREVVDDRRMPPWHADPRYGHFKNDRRLSPKERAVLLAWVDQGAPLGDVAKLPPPRTFPDGWGIGTPDLVFEIPEPFLVPAQGTVDYVRFRVPTNFKEDTWVQAAEARPGDRKIVHHIIVYVNDRKAFRSDLKGAADAHLCGYAPGDMPSVYPEGSAKLVPAGSELIFEIHYTPDGKSRADRSKVGLVLAKAPVARRAHTLGIAQPRFEIPPGADDYPVRSRLVVPADAHLLSFMPHMHLRGKSFEYTATFPDGRKETLLSVPAYDFGWQTYYTLAEPLALPKGTVIECLAHFDNSAGNPANPDPTKAVRWGKQTWEEMMIGYIDYVDDAPPGSKTNAKAKTADVSLPKPAEVLRTLRRLEGARASAGSPGR